MNSWRVFILVLLFAFAVANFLPTPVGWVEDRCLHKSLKSGDHIVELQNGETIITNEFDPNRRVVLKPSNCRIIPRRSPLNETRNGNQRPYSYDGWLAYTTFSYPSGLDSFLGYFSVPDAPQQNPEVLYLFTGLQNIDWIPIVDPDPSGPFDIIQPVLQYPGDGGNYWSVKSWYVTLDSGVVVSDEIPVKVGDTIFGNMTRLSGNNWYIGGTSLENKRTSSITVNRARLQVQPWAYNTAECYGCDYGGCATEPKNPIKFTKLALYAAGKQVTPSWVVHRSPNPQCNEQAHVQDPATVSISFQ